MTAIPPTQLKTASLNQASASAQAQKPVAKAATKTATGDDKFSFWDLVDIINPLQHIPVVNTIYRELTGDKINNFSRIAGGALFGGFIGAAIGGVNAIAVNETGQDLGDIAMTKMGFKDAPPPVTKTAAAPKSIDGIPVIEVRPPVRVVMAETREKITWDDTPVANVAAAATPAGQTGEQAQAADPHIAAAMPEPKDLNALQPGSSDATAPHQVDAAQVPTTMMKALAKYESMQRLGNAAAEETGKIPTTGRKFAGLDMKTVRRY